MPISMIHLAENNAAARRDSTTGRAYPLGEQDRPSRTVATSAELEAIVRYLDVEHSARYQPTPASTFCNIYACDYCYLAGAYLPRVWWTEATLKRLRADESVEAAYGVTVGELNANSLFAWLRDFGPSFGWRPRASIDELQNAANQGQVAVICAQRKVLAQSGHIAVVVPESTPPLIAERDAGYIRLPLQSQAGRRIFCFSCGHGRWWEGAQFHAYGFWTHA